MGHRNSRGSVIIGSATGAALICAAPLLAGCSSSSHSASVSASGAATPGTTTPSPSSSPAASTNQTSARGVIITWVTAIIEGNITQACEVSAQPASGATPAETGSPTLCSPSSPLGQQIFSGLKSMRASFTPRQATGQPVVRVTQVPMHAGTAAVPARDITIDGQPLSKVIMSHSTGIKPGQLHVEIDADKIAGTWYVTNFDLNLGGSVNIGSSPSS